MAAKNSVEGLRGLNVTGILAGIDGVTKKSRE